MIRYWAREYGRAYRELYDLVAAAPVVGWIFSAFPMPASRSARACGALRRDMLVTR